MNEEKQSSSGTFLHSVLDALGTFEKVDPRLTTTLQVRVTSATADKLDALIAEARAQGVPLTRSDLLRAAVSALVAGAEVQEKVLAESA